MLHGQNDFAGCAHGRREDVRQFTSDHQLNERGLIDGGYWMSADAFAIAEDGDAIRQREDFLESMRDINDPDTGGAQFAHDLEQEIHFFPGERGRRFVHDHDPRAGSDGAGNLDQLLLGHGELTHLFSWSISAPIRARSFLARSRRSFHGTSRKRRGVFEPQSNSNT